jgi:hypothetical protein
VTGFFTESALAWAQAGRERPREGDLYTQELARGSERLVPRPFSDKVPASTPAEMRQQLFWLMRDRWREASPSMAGPIVLGAESLANREGWTGEDKYTVIAYSALRALDQLYRNHLELVNYLPPTPLVVAPADPKP